MLKIYIARHGQDEDNAKGLLNGRRDTPLTALGVAQAQALAAEIKKAGFTFVEVCSSPLARAYRTAEIIAQALGLARPETMGKLIEREFGTMTGKPVADVEKLCAPDILKTGLVVYFLSPAGAETFPELLARGTRALEEIKTRHAEGNILLVTHGDIGKMIYAAYYGLDWKSVLRMFHFGNSDLLLLAEDSPPEAAHVFKFAQHNH